MSARGNALTLTSSLPATAVLRALNGIAPEIFFTAISEVPMEFSARTAARRWYRYFEPSEGRRLERWQDAAMRFRGEIDVRSFGRDMPVDHALFRTIHAVRVRRSGARWFVVDIRAPAFVWGMVRKIIASLRKVDDGTLSLTRLEGVLRGEYRLTLPLAEPEGLVLWEVTYPMKWSRTWGGPNRGQARHLAELVRRGRLRESIGRELLGQPTGRKERGGR